MAGTEPDFFAHEGDTHQTQIKRENPTFSAVWENHKQATCWCTRTACFTGSPKTEVTMNSAARDIRNRRKSAAAWLWQSSGSTAQARLQRKQDQTWRAAAVAAKTSTPTAQLQESTGEPALAPFHQKRTEAARCESPNPSA
jgi:hypothetical protein